MNIELESTEVIAAQKPRVFLKGITFNDGTPLPLEHNSIVVFTGANNSGKSQVLKDAEHCLDKSNETPTVVIKSTEYDYCGTIAYSRAIWTHIPELTGHHFRFLLDTGS